MMVFSVDSPGISAAGKVAVWNMHVNVYYRNVENVRCFFSDLWKAIRNYNHDMSRFQKKTFRHRVRGVVCQE